MQTPALEKKRSEPTATTIAATPTAAIPMVEVKLVADKIYGDLAREYDWQHECISVTIRGERTIVIGFLEYQRVWPDVHMEILVHMTDRRFSLSLRTICHGQLVLTANDWTTTGYTRSYSEALLYIKHVCDISKAEIISTFNRGDVDIIDDFCGVTEQIWVASEDRDHKLMGLRGYTYSRPLRLPVLRPLTPRPLAPQPKQSVILAELAGILPQLVTPAQQVQIRPVRAKTPVKSPVKKNLLEAIPEENSGDGIDGGNGSDGSDGGDGSDGSDGGDG